MNTAEVLNTPGYYYAIAYALSVFVIACNRIIYICDAVWSLRILCVICTFRGLHNVCSLTGAFLHHKSQNKIYICRHIVFCSNLFYIAAIRFAGRVDHMSLSGSTEWS